MWRHGVAWKTKFNGGITKFKSETREPQRNRNTSEERWWRILIIGWNRWCGQQVYANHDGIGRIYEIWNQNTSIPKHRCKCKSKTRSDYARYRQIITQTKGRNKPRKQGAKYIVHDNNSNPCQIVSWRGWFYYWVLKHECTTTIRQQYTQQQRLPTSNKVPDGNIIPNRIRREKESVIRFYSSRGGKQG